MCSMKKKAKGHTDMNAAITYAGYRFPPELISYAVWLYFRFPLSLRMVEEMLAARGIEVTYETVRRWALKFGNQAARRIRARPAAFGDKWHLDEVVITINGKKHWLWRAVDQFGVVLDGLSVRFVTGTHHVVKCRWR
jgi:putative transposase